MAEIASREIGRLGISRAAVQKQRERRRATRKLRVDIRREEPGPLKIDHLCSYFDVDRCSSPYELVESIWGDDYDIQLYGRLGLCCYNFQQGTNLKFVRWEKYYNRLTAYDNFYITLEAMDPACPRVLPFQTMVSDVGYGEGLSLKWRTLASREKCNETVNDYWGDTAIDAFYKGAMPKWLSHVEADNKKYYVVQESELLENDWLHLFSEIALYRKSNWTLESPPLLEIKNVVIETKEEYTTEAREKLKANNAIFYISFKYNGDPSTGWGAGDHKAIIRKTMDGRRGHMCLEVARGTEEEELCSDGLPPDVYYSNMGYTDSLLLYFPEYSEDDLRLIFLRNPANRKLYSAFLDVVLRPFCRVTRRVEELSTTFASLFRKYSEPLDDLGISPNEEMKRRLYSHLKPLIAPCLNEIFRVSSHPHDGDTRGERRQKVSYSSETREELEVLDFHMSTSAKYLLITAFLASRNPATLDASMFDSTGGMDNRKRKRKASEKSMEKKEIAEQEAVMKGPGSFPLERLLAIFQCIASVGDSSFGEEDEEEEEEATGYDREIIISCLIFCCKYQVFVMQTF